MNPAVAAHHAAANLVRGRALGDVYAKSLNVEYCLSELTSMGEPDTKETKYHPKWKSWPGTINISGDDSNRINGTYQRLRCQQTIVLSALWRTTLSIPAP